ncbi:aldo/keto reductase [Maricaulis maris]|uniref:Aryl-alcohol dehydrogenase-like predicted oxidoreductase n=1 Tax=Maricaulis maris TaxID=74318 RepID=A0A495DCM2_9PROT|nr:aldo/keto reductase [Maricaulis maris]RKR00067.1 aryl-alcohol dehydrogenase-like predicted oxidoreductase [Maricaulis maris]
MIDADGFSRLGFGVTGPHAGLGAGRGATTRLIHQAIDLGVTLFDTGPAYGRGEAERRLGAALKTVPRAKVFVATKAGVHAGGHRDLSAGAVEMSLRDSLKRLQRDHVDLLLLHGPAPDELTDKLIRRLQAFRDRGMIRHIGVCGRGGELDRAIELGVFDALMAPVNARLTEAERQRLEQARAAGLSVIGIETMAGASQAPSVPGSRGDLWYLAQRVKQRLQRHPVAPTTGSPADSLRWALSQPYANSVMCLTTKPSHLAANAALVAALEAKQPTS